jgi:hypothetical protein
MSKKKRKSSRGSRQFEADTLRVSALQLSAAPASRDETRCAGSPPGNSSAEWFSPELIRHLIDRIKDI